VRCYVLYRWPSLADWAWVSFPGSWHKLTFLCWRAVRQPIIQYRLSYGVPSTSLIQPRRRSSRCSVMSFALSTPVHGLTLALLTLLDLSAAFDTVDHAKLLRRLSYSLNWRGRHQLVHFVPPWPHTVCSLWPGQFEISTVVVGRAAGSVLEPILFRLYTADWLRLI